MSILHRYWDMALYIILDFAEMVLFPGLKDWNILKWCKFISLPDCSPFISMLAFTHIVIIFTLVMILSCILLCYHFVNLFFHIYNIVTAEIVHGQKYYYHRFCLPVQSLMKCFWGVLKIQRYKLCIHIKPRNIVIWFPGHITQL